MPDMGLKLSQGQVWKQGGVYFRIVRLERLSVEYKEFLDPADRKGAHHQATKKEFCRLIKGAELIARTTAASEMPDNAASESVRTGAPLVAHQRPPRAARG